MNRNCNLVSSRSLQVPSVHCCCFVVCCQGEYKSVYSTVCIRNIIYSPHSEACTQHSTCTAHKTARLSRVFGYCKSLQARTRQPSRLNCSFSSCSAAHIAFLYPLCCWSGISTRLVVLSSFCWIKQCRKTKKRGKKYYKPYKILKFMLIY